ncbi:MAG: hypothetical protein IJU18_02010 [Oscillospiraceae bacterium]|nr:hypothetical protein [Oscillospiraceae bacterium]
MQRKHLTILLVVVGALMILSTVGMDFLWGKMLDYTPVLNERWGLNTPSEAKWDTIYGSQETDSGAVCHVLTYKNAEPLESMVPWGVAGDEDVQTAKEWLGTLELNEEKYWPRWEQCRYYEAEKTGGERLMIFWDSENIILYVLEWFPEAS